MPPPPFQRPRHLYERLLLWVVLALLLAYTYAYFFVAPYIGFSYSEMSGRVQRLFVPGELRPGDVLLQVGNVDFAAFRANLVHPSPFSGVAPGTPVPLTVLREGSPVRLTWVFPGWTATEFWLGRAASHWFLAYGLWGIGTLALLMLRPRDRVQRLFVAFNYVTAVWVIASTAVPSHLAYGPLIFRTAAWLSLPIYWHLHWVFPRPLTRLPRPLVWSVYGAAVIAALLHWLQVIPRDAYLLALGLAALGSLVLGLAHAALMADRQRDVLLILAGGAVALLPLLAIILSALQLGYVQPLAPLALLALPLLPVTYLAAMARRRAEALEVRANRWLSLYLFGVLLAALLVGLVGLVDNLVEFPGDTLAVSVGTGLIAALAAVAVYDRFQAGVEYYLLGVPPAPRQLLETYAARIATHLEAEGVVRLLRDEILPSLLVRQSALLVVKDPRYFLPLGTPPAAELAPLYATGVGPSDFPTLADWPVLEAEAGQYRPLVRGAAGALAWVRLALPLRLGRRTVGWWLLGRRDPDDEYAASEIGVLQALADQTAVALAHVRQADLLRAAYKADVDQMEAERAHLARELHDHVLHELFHLVEGGPAGRQDPQVSETYERLATWLRQTMTQLRPAMLDYGLCGALNALADVLADRTQGQTEVTFDVPDSQARYPADVEQHLYRIVQQACENALRHAQPRHLRIEGRVAPEGADLVVADDGQGFEAAAVQDLAGLLAEGHFGLVTMYERAALIGAHMHIDSAPGRGTRIRLQWQAGVRDG